MNKRWWRVMRGLRRSVGDSLRRPEPDERRLNEAIAEAEARAQAQAEIEARLSLPSPGRTAPPPEVHAPLPDPPTAEPLATTPDPLAAHYATLGLPAGSGMERVEHAYRRLKERWNPEHHADDPARQAQARQQEARVEEAYQALKQALVRERRL